MALHRHQQQLLSALVTAPAGAGMSVLHTARVIVCGANLLPVRAGCTFCHEQQKVPKNALGVTVAALALRAPPKLTKPISETDGANRQPARAGLSRRRDARGDCTVDSFPCQGNVPGASISLREDDAGPRLRRDARGRAYRAGGFIPPSEYEIIGVPTKPTGFVGRICSFCHEQQKEPKNALDVTVAARTADGAA